MGKTQRQRRRDDSDSYSATLSGLQQQLERRRRRDELCQIKCCDEMDGLLFSVENKEKMKRWEGGNVAMATREEIYRSTRWWRATQRRIQYRLPCRNKLLMRKSRNERPKKTKTNRITSSENQTYPGWLAHNSPGFRNNCDYVRYVEPAKWLWRDEGPAAAQQMPCANISRRI